MNASTGNSCRRCLLSICSCLKTIYSLNAHSCCVVDGLTGMDVQVSNAPVTRVHVVMVMVVGSVALSEMSVHVQMVVRGSSEHVSVLCCKLVDPLLGAGHC